MVAGLWPIQVSCDSRGQVGALARHASEQGREVRVRIDAGFRLEYARGLMTLVEDARQTPRQAHVHRPGTAHASATKRAKVDAEVLTENGK